MQGPKFKPALPRSFVSRPKFHQPQPSGRRAVGFWKCWDCTDAWMDIWPALQVISGAMTKDTILGPFVNFMSHLQMKTYMETPSGSFVHLRLENFCYRIKNVGDAFGMGVPSYRYMYASSFQESPYGASGMLIHFASLTGLYRYHISVYTDAGLTVGMLAVTAFWNTVQFVTVPFDCDQFQLDIVDCFCLMLHFFHKFDQLLTVSGAI